MDELCSGAYDAVVYNPAGFGAVDLVDTSQSRTTETGNDVSQRSEARERVNVQRPGRFSVLEYGLARVGCPVVIIQPRHAQYKSAVRRCTQEWHVSLIAGLSGSASYRLALSAVDDMLRSSH